MPLPTFLVIGAAKAGTTSLHHYLRRHPQVFLPAVKETNYFLQDTDAGLEDYARSFAPAGDRPAVGEVSPRYLNSPTAAERIRRDLPDARLVVCLRDPAARAYSDYLGRVRILRERRSFAEATRPGEPCREWGFYHPRLERFYARFPRERIHVVLHEELADDTAAALRRLLAFIEVDPTVTIDVSRRHNRAAVPRSRAVNRALWPAVLAAQRAVPASRRGSGRAARLLERTYRTAPPLDPAPRRELVAIYREDVIATGRLIGRDLSAWLA